MRSLRLIQSGSWTAERLTYYLVSTEFGKEKQEALSGEFEYAIGPTRILIADVNSALGLSDSQIEERITTLVKQSS